MWAMETAAICLTECVGVCGGKSPVFKHEADDPDWHGWDKYSGDRTQIMEDPEYYDLRNYALDFLYRRFAHDDTE